MLLRRLYSSAPTKMIVVVIMMIIVIIIYFPDFQRIELTFLPSYYLYLFIYLVIYFFYPYPRLTINGFSRSNKHSTVNPFWRFNEPDQINRTRRPD